MGVNRSDILPAAVAAWTHATKPENLIAGFRATGIYPFNPLAYLKSTIKHTKSTSLTLLPQLLPPSLATDTDTPNLAALVQSPLLTDSTQTPTTTAEPVKKRVRRTLDTSAGVLLTGAETLAQLRAVAEAVAEEERAKKAKVEDRKVKRAEKERLTVEKRAARAVKKAGRAAAVEAAAVAKAEKRKREEAAEAASEDKENVDPNASTAVRAAPKPARFVCTVVRERGGAVLKMKKTV